MALMKSFQLENSSVKTAVIRTLAAAVFLLTTLSFTANAEEVVGIINGYNCATKGLTCPVDHLDPHLALERDFVVQKADGSFVLIPNVPRDVKVRHVLQRVRVTGDLNPKYDTLTAKEVAVYDKQSKTFDPIWSPEMEKAERRRQIERVLQRSFDG